MSQIVKLPSALCHGHLPAGLTAPSMRITLLLVAAADDLGRINVLKPPLEKASGVRMDNAASRLSKLVDTLVLNTDGGPIRVFDSLEYVPGEQKRLAGLVWGHLAIEFRHLIAEPRWKGKKVEASTVELGRLSTIPGIALWLHLLPIRAPTATEVRLRLKDEGAASIFGSYVNRAIVSRANVDGEVFEWTSLSRLFDELVEPAVKDLWGALEGWTIDATPAVPAQRQHGRAWSHIDISVQRLQKRKSLRELANATRAGEEYTRRKHNLSNR